ncbi:hypothetical protein M9980_06955 [Sphingomonas donggukensis]|uniref:Cell division protein FtsL n=1 Tax=Sphingomonas donggukensis TaxID=2949093 RepID=A0ABY4TWZ5_9SPHN|nr:hypothetical protein [Sphingomonas donggukensis]URW76925.1 hypothetical protein M9980_06955 [Sphingomonas donggukensis]
MAVSGFKGFGYLLCFATVSPACYMVSSQVAAERGRVESVERAILQAKVDIRTLETEFDTRANHDQLERWNGDVLALSAPRPEQYLASDMALASLQPLGGGETRLAAAVVPAAVTVQPAAIQAASFDAGAPAAAVAAPAPAPQPAIRKAVATVPAGAAPRPRPIQAVAMVERRLLSDSTLGDLTSSARAERVAMR